MEIKKQAVRGSELKKRMKESQVTGENFRSINQGTDLLETKINHPKNTTQN